MDNNQKPVNVIAEVVDVAEKVNYLELTSRICYYDEPNLNGDMLIFDENALSRAETLVNMPVQARYRANLDGTPSLGGHEMVKHKDGTYEFKTQSIGVHTGVEIKNDNVVINGEVKNLPCLFASYRIWKRYPNIIAAVKRLFEKNILYGSWEISTYQYIFDNGIRKITDYEFIANTLLGESSFPSYGISATALTMAELQDNQLNLEDALSQDLLDENINDNKEEDQLVSVNETSAVENVVSSVEEVNTENVIAENTEVVEPVVEPTEVVENTEITEPVSAENVNEEAPVIDSAQLTDYDLRTKVREACRAKLDKWCWVSFMFPNEKEAWCEYEGRETELDYVKFTYEVGENDVITVSEPEYVKLTVSVAEINSKVDELIAEINNVKAELDTRNNAIAEANETIQNLKSEVAELKPYKEQIEIAEQKKVEETIAAEKESLRNRLLKGNLFTEEEIAEQSIQELIEARDSSAINNLIAERFIASFDSKEEKTEETTIASVDEDVVSASVNLEVDEPEMDIRSFMNQILFK